MAKSNQFIKRVIHHCARPILFASLAVSIVACSRDADRNVPSHTPTPETTAQSAAAKMAKSGLQRAVFSFKGKPQPMFFLQGEPAVKRRVRLMV